MVWPTGPNAISDSSAAAGDANEASAAAAAASAPNALFQLNRVFMEISWCVLRGLVRAATHRD
jgi:hypothetical protein